MKAKDLGAPPELWNENISICKQCGEPIAWGIIDGKWIPMRPDFTGFHKCSLHLQIQGRNNNE